MGPMQSDSPHICVSWIGEQSSCTKKTFSWNRHNIPTRFLSNYYAATTGRRCQQKRCMASIDYTLLNEEIRIRFGRHSVDLRHAQTASNTDSESSEEEDIRNYEVRAKVKAKDVEFEEMNENFKFESGRLVENGGYKYNKHNFCEKFSFQLWACSASTNRFYVGFKRTCRTKEFGNETKICIRGEHNHWAFIQNINCSESNTK